MISELLREIWQTARHNKLRTSLTGFSVAWGIFMLIVLLGAGNGLINSQEERSNRFLTNSMYIGTGYTLKAFDGLKEGRRITLSDRDIEATEQEFGAVIDDVGMVYSQGATITFGQQFLTTTVNGVTPNHFQIDKKEMLFGRFINAIDLTERRKVLVIGNNQARELTKSPEALLSKHVKVGNLMFLVVGIYKEQENGRAEMYAPYTTMRAIYDHTGDAGRIEFSFHGLKTEQANEAFEQQYRARLASNHQMAPDDEGGIWIWNRFTQALQMDRGVSILRMALWIVGLFTLLSGIVGVSNIMLITVKERTHEFGIRKAIGAKPWSILRLIITESIIITTLFGYIGMLCGMAVNKYMDITLGHSQIDTGLFRTTMFVDPTVGLETCLAATLVMIVAGTIAGLIPAFKASRIRPIEALRG